jgi:hypothetical protein
VPIPARDRGSTTLQRCEALPQNREQRVPRDSEKEDQAMIRAVSLAALYFTALTFMAVAYASAPL